MTSYAPETPGGTILLDLESPTEEEAWAKLLKATSHMPYKTKQDLINRGYCMLSSEDESNNET